jgi:chromosome segregation ATPase
MKRHAAKVKDLEARRRAEDEKIAREFADLEAQLKGAEGRACKAEAQADALADSRADLRRKINALQRSIGRGEERLREIEDSRVSSSGASSSTITFTEDEVEEMEGVMGDLTAQLAELSKLRKGDEAEYDRNRQAVAGFRGKYRELAEQTRANIALQAKLESLQAELDKRGPPPLVPRASWASMKANNFDIQRDFTKRGGPYPPFFADLIAPAMLDTVRHRSK